MIYKEFGGILQRIINEPTVLFVRLINLGIITFIKTAPPVPCVRIMRRRMGLAHPKEEKPPYLEEETKAKHSSCLPFPSLSLSLLSYRGTQNHTIMKR